MYNLIVGSLLISFLLAVWSWYRERTSQEVENLRRHYRQTKIKGTIVLGKGKEGKHYSSNSR